MRIVPLILIGLLVLAAAGRYYAEAQVRQRQQELARLQETREQTLSEIDSLRLDVQVLESATRLRELNDQRLDLVSVRAEQLLTPVDLARLVGMVDLDEPDVLPPEADIIGNAIGMADPVLAEQARSE